MLYISTSYYEQHDLLVHVEPEQHDPLNPLGAAISIVPDAISKGSMFINSLSGGQNGCWETEGVGGSVKVK